MGKLVPIIMLLVGVGAGIGAGIVLAPAPEEHAIEGAGAGTDGDQTEGTGDHSENSEHGDDHASADGTEPKGGSKQNDHGKTASKPKSGDHGDEHEEGANAPEFVKLNNQFVVPVVADGQVQALVVVTLSLETAQGLRDAIYAREPKLRDAFLQVLFDHSNMGGFQGAFTRSNNLDVLRDALRQVARNEFGNDVHNVLIVDIARQDV